MAPLIRLSVSCSTVRRSWGFREVSSGESELFTTQFVLTSLGSIGLNLVSMLIIPPVRELLSIGTTIFSLFSLFSCANFGIPFCAKKNI